MGSNNTVANFSSSQQFAAWQVPDVIAPGVGVISAMPGGGFQEMDGSSMATPHIAGLAALLWSAVPTATVDQVEQAIFSSCHQLPTEPDARQNRGIPDAVAALAALQAAVNGSPAPVTTPTESAATKKAATKKAATKKAAKKKSTKAVKKSAQTGQKTKAMKAKKAVVKNVKSK